MRGFVRKFLCAIGWHDWCIARATGKGPLVLCCAYCGREALSPHQARSLANLLNKKAVEADKELGSGT